MKIPDKFEKTELWRSFPSKFKIIYLLILQSFMDRIDTYTYKIVNKYN